MNDNNEALQLDFFEAKTKSEDHDFLSRQLITYIGNKRSLLDFIGNSLNVVKKKLGKEKISCFDVFSGSGVVARYLKQHASLLIVNDVEKYSEVINSCYLSNKSDVPFIDIKNIFLELETILSNESNYIDGFIRKLYSPSNINDVKHGERCFYTPRNARYIDTARSLIKEIPQNIQPYFMAPLLSSASVHANTSGVFKGFYKNTETGIGQFGGNGRNALTRIFSDIKIEKPIFSNFECEIDIHRGDANVVADSTEEVDVAYIDPPYNQHPYGSNYFMLNLIVDYCEPEDISKVSGIPKTWYRSDYNKKPKAKSALKNLVEKIKAKYLLISFNSEGFVSKEDMIEILSKIGRVDVVEQKYNAFRGSRNLFVRDTHVKEYIFIVEKN